MTAIDLDPALLERALAVSEETTQDAVVTRALEEFVARRQRVRLVELLGTLDWDETFDHKADRTRR